MPVTSYTMKWYILTIKCFKNQLPVALQILLPTGFTSGRSRPANGLLITLFDGAQGSIPCMALEGPYNG